MYIRTKDGVYEVIEEINYGGEMFYYIKSKPPRKAFEECEILKQSENLDELCDEFVYYNPKTQIEKYRYEYYHNLSEKEYDMLFLKKGGTIYGAIWTDKGLIYVAKMSSEGKLVLI